jgi:hypothetical protein
LFLLYLELVWALCAVKNKIDTGCKFDATWQAKEPTSKKKRFFQWQSNQWQRKAMMIKHELQAHICKFV